MTRTYKNNKTKMAWRCARGHWWWARADAVMRRRRPSWCPVCAKRDRWTIAELQAIAIQRGGACESPVLERTTKPLRWRCADAHLWMASGQDIVAGHWCPDCARRRVRDTATGRFESTGVSVRKFERVQKDRAAAANPIHAELVETAARHPTVARRESVAWYWLRRIAELILKMAGARGDVGSYEATNTDRKSVV